VILGFLELGLALKFLSNVDLAYHWGFLKREIFLGIWLVIAVAAGLYLLGKIRFPHDSVVKKLSAPRIAFATLFFAFALYLIPGLNGANLKLLSGFPPPMFYSIFETKSKCPHDINCFKDLNEGLAYAKIVNKPVMVDFTGWSCVNCRKMEENVWIEPEILKLIDEKYVLVSLYVDDKTPLPEMEQKISECTGKKIRTIGNKWSEYQTCTFQTNTQPYYVLMKQTGEILNTPVGYTPDAGEYKKFLEEGLSKFKPTALK
jgi:thiol:disulfide interchange protein DsbD